MNKTTKSLSILGAALSVAGFCSTASAFESKSWRADLNQDTVMYRTSDGLCWLTGIAGAFEGWGEEAYVTKKWIGNDEYWVLTGTSQQSGTSASAVCEYWDMLEYTPGSHTIMNDNYVTAYPGCSSNLSCPTATLWNEYSFCWLNGIHGALNGWGEDAHVHSDGSQWYNSATCGSGSYTQSIANCAYFGQPSPLVYEPTQPWHQGMTQPIWLGSAVADPVSQSIRICALTEVSGKFRGWGESVGVYLDRYNLNWYLFGNSQQVDVEASAQCVLLKGYDD